MAQTGPGRGQRRAAPSVSPTGSRSQTKMTSGRSNVVQPAARSSERSDEDVDEEWRRTPLEQRLDRFKAELEDALSADRSLRQHENEPTAGGADGAGQDGEARICASVLRSYVHCVHEAMQNKEGRFLRLLRQLEESRAEAEFLRLAPSREAVSAADYDLYEARLAASDRDTLRAKDRMLQLYDEREEENQRSLDKLHDTIRTIAQRVDLLLVTQASGMPSAVCQDLQLIMQMATSSLPPQDHPPHELGEYWGRLYPPRAEDHEIICKRATVDSISREMEQLQIENEALHRRLEEASSNKERLEVSIDETLASIHEDRQSEKRDLLNRFHALQAQTDAAMSNRQALLSRHAEELAAKQKEVDAAYSQMASCKTEVVALSKDNVALQTEINKRDQEADARLRAMRDDHLQHVQRKDQRIERLLIDLDESRKAYLKVVGELSERAVLEQRIKHPDPTEEQIAARSEDRKELQRMWHDSEITMRSVRKGHADFVAAIRSRLRARPGAGQDADRESMPVWRVASPQLLPSPLSRVPIASPRRH